MTDELITIRDYSNDPPRPLYEQSRFWVNGREFNRESEGSLVWHAADGYRFWLGEKLPTGEWTMGADAGSGEAFAFGIYEGPGEVLAAFERMVAK